MSNAMTDLDALARQLHAVLQARGATVTCAESCTGGWLAKVLTDIPGSSASFGYGFVTYSNRAKQALLGVRADTLARHGAVSEATVREMAEGALARARADLAVAISGIAGPGGGSPGKPVGTVCFGLAAAGRPTRAETRHFAGDRTAVRRQSVAHALRRLLAATGGE